MNDVIKQTSHILTLTTEAERQLLSKLAKEVKPGGLIVEIGALYGGVTAVLALSAPQCKVITIDNFSWHPDGEPVTSPLNVKKNMESVGADNVDIIHATSQAAFLTWNKKPIDLLWIDGGHSFKYVYFDLYNYGRHAQVVALHDFGNPAWPDIGRAINVFLSREKGWTLDTFVDMVAVLRRK